MTNAEVIETLRANYPDACYEQLREAVDAAIEALKAQDAAGDAINRQGAIDAIEHRLAEPAYQHTGEDWYVGMNCAESELYVLPSAQPEIIRCKDCKWCEDADGLMCKNTASWVVATDYDFGCVLAERRQDG